MNKSKINLALKNVQRFHDGELVLKYNLQTLNIKNGIDWEYEHPTNHSTYQVYLHSLSIINDFVIVGTQTENIRELLFARKLIYEWFLKGKNSKFSWHEHAVSTRLLNIIKFQEKAGEYKLESNFFESILKEHCLFLNDDSNYKHNNHGLMMDNALITASAFIEDSSLRNNYINKALSRIRVSVYRDLTVQGIHVENSPEYHNLYIILLNQIFHTLKKYDFKLERNIHFLRQAAIEKRASLLKPNNEFPLLGDTGQTKYPSIKKSFEDIVDLEAGLVVLQDEDEMKQEFSRYFTFKCGYISKTHKHFDDLSITYYNNGHDVIIDPGKYSYNKDSDREYIISPAAHSTITLENESYPLHQVGQSLRDRLKITKYFYTDDYHLVEGINDLYENAKISRTCIVTKLNDLIIIDKVSKESDGNALQIFNINENAKITQDENSFDIRIDDSSYSLELLSPTKNVESKIIDSFISKKFGKKTNNKKICFQQNSSEIIFATLLRNTNSNIQVISVNKNQVKLIVEDKTLDIMF
ncbi:alginate lyase family protein [Aliicoccus persicus]|uniref:Heparinase II/III N-terminus n=1 Tax=Aliicoccus persicus TaxID=930138 RepID=A0A662Z1S8_9STAP|nr:alginate lyase family protein [Aliicoccus persicus]SEV79588.1 Heparinase II/III N-terminus [Aliicoccus persicus]